MNKEYRKFIEKTLEYLSGNPDDRDVYLTLAKGIEIKKYLEDFLEFYDRKENGKDDDSNEVIKPNIEYDEKSLQELLDVVSFVLKKRFVEDIDYYELSETAGIYVTRAIEKMDEDEIEIELRYPIDYIGYGLKKNKRIIVNGNVKWFTGDLMENGEIIIEGNAEKSIGTRMKGGRIVVKERGGAYIGTLMEGGEIIVEGYGDLIGINMKGGRIVVKGYVSGTIGLHMENGEIYAKNLDVSRISKDAKKGRIYRGVPGDAELVWEDGKIVEHKEDKKLVEHKDIMKINVPEINQIIYSWARYNPDNVIEMFRKHMSREPDEDELMIIKDAKKKYNNKSTEYKRITEISTEYNNIAEIASDIIKKLKSKSPSDLYYNLLDYRSAIDNIEYDKTKLILYKILDDMSIIDIDKKDKEVLIDFFETIKEYPEDMEKILVWLFPDKPFKNIEEEKKNIPKVSSEVIDSLEELILSNVYRETEWNKDYLVELLDAIRCKNHENG